MTKQRIAGSIVIILNIYYVYHYAELWYLYEYTDILWFMMLLTWEIIMNLIVGVAAIFLGLKVFNHSFSIVKGASISLLLMMQSQLITLMVH